MTHSIKNSVPRAIMALGMALCLTPNSSSAAETSFEVVGAWESEYIFRGVQLQQNSFQPSAQINIDQFYFGAWAALPTEKGGAFDTEVDLYGGFGVPVNESTALDFGFTYYTYPENSAFIGGSGNTFETFAGIAYEGALSPSLYGFYDFDLKTFTIEASLSHSWALSKGYSFDVGSTLGGIYSNSARGFAYYGVSADISHELNENATASIGARWNGASENTFFDKAFAGVPTRFADNSISFGFSVTLTR